MVLPLITKKKIFDAGTPDAVDAGFVFGWWGYPDFIL
jgi:hypothetical protein